MSMGKFTCQIARDGRCVITGYSDRKATTIVVPSTIDGNLIDVIGKSAFADMSELQKVFLPDSIQEISEWAFEGCVSLETLVLGRNVREIKALALWACLKLKRVITPPQNPYLVSNEIGLFSPDFKILYAAYSPDSEIYQVPVGVTEIAANAFAVNQHFRHITLPNTVAILQRDAFSGCDLEEISLPDQITDIPPYCFAGCGSLKKIHLPEQLRTIGDYAFQDCAELSELNIPPRLEEIGEYAFSYCDKVPPSIADALGRCPGADERIFDDY